jgi:hypothetical protein
MKLNQRKEQTHKHCYRTNRRSADREREREREREKDVLTQNPVKKHFETHVTVYIDMWFI